MDGAIVTDPTLIRRHYSQSLSFAVDIISAIPLDFIPITVFRPLLRINKVARVTHLYEYFNNVETLFVQWKQDASTSARRVFRLYFLLVVVIHWVGCGWYLISKISVRAGEKLNWIDEDRMSEDLKIDPDGAGGLVGYLRAIYFVLVGASTIGYGDILPHNMYETNYATAAMLFGGLFKPTIVGEWHL